MRAYVKDVVVLAVVMAVGALIGIAIVLRFVK
jgi:hypothetical protein